ncbi:MAG: ROK family protein [Candidatus Thiodiazotropha taylori]|nr:ROK family protein [Candidatus Thiodiazotropha taylori]MCW4223708.1 ROK family protein [Candidatus Thiodiazotropha endolucinida]MCG7882771.1 ROK family protein [Candidatus Thiodiazotropha taylori]MCG7885285.1 ROK family protein [Candidatus Thiodiazotropha taylori]MCG8035379.1 ROK family protein [Candidatus Thiodiazotropha taylori]
MESKLLDRTIEVGRINEGLLLIDIGGTRIRAARVVGNEIRETMNQIVGLSLLDIIQQIKAEISKVSTATKEVSVACPGLVKPDGAVGAALHSAVSDTNLQENLTRELELPTYVYNDAYAQSLGIPKVLESTVFLSLGTSIGGAFLPVNNPIRGAHGYGGEVGHMPTSFATGNCRCGKRHCLDLVASGWSLERDLGRGWWKSLSKAVEMRIELAGKAVAELSTRLMPFTDHGVLSVAGHLVRHETFRNALDVANEAQKTIWPSARIEYISNFELLTWVGLCKAHIQKNRIG